MDLLNRRVTWLQEVLGHRPQKRSRRFGILLDFFNGLVEAPSEK